jgi:hypothetical protein
MDTRDLAVITGCDSGIGRAGPVRGVHGPRKVRGGVGGRYVDYKNPGANNGRGHRAAVPDAPWDIRVKG